MLLFLNGTLLDPLVLARQSGERGLARRLRPARLEGYARAGLRGTPHPTLVRRPGAATPGVVLRVGPAARRRLAAYEGAQHRLVPVRVETRRGPAQAPAWMAARWRAAMAPAQISVDHTALRPPEGSVQTPFHDPLALNETYGPSRWSLHPGQPSAGVFISF